MIDFFSFIGIPFGWVMYGINSVINNYGITLIIFAILVKVIMIPLGIKQQKSMVINARMQPKMREIQKKYATNRQKYGEELQKLYDKEKFSPYASCLPMAIQLPLLFGMLDVIYYPIKHLIRIPAEVTTKAIEIATTVLGQAGMSTYSKEMSVLTAIKSNPQPFFDGLGTEMASKIADFDFTMFGLFLGEQPRLTPGGMAIGLYAVLLLIPILSGITSLFMSIVTMKATSAGDPSQAGMQTSMMIMMPLMSVWISFVVPAGVGIYWLISNILSGIQSVILNKYMNPAEEIAKAKAEEEAEREKEREERIEAKRLTRERYQADQISGKHSKDRDIDLDAPVDEKSLSQKELNRRKLAAARLRDAERYGEVYVDVTDDDIR